jgi:hypothetical protein
LLRDLIVRRQYDVIINYPSNRTLIHKILQGIRKVHGTLCTRAYYYLRGLACLSSERTNHCPEFGSELPELFSVLSFRSRKRFMSLKNSIAKIILKGIYTCSTPFPSECGPSLSRENTEHVAIYSQLATHGIPAGAVSSSTTQ